MTLRTEPKVGVLGQTGKVSYVTMRPDIARLVRAAASGVGKCVRRVSPPTRRYPGTSSFT